MRFLVCFFVFCVVTVRNVPGQEPTPKAGQHASQLAAAESVLRLDNLVAWCIVPFDSARRGPAARAKMLRELGIVRCAYDWRAEHVKDFEEEIVQYREHGIEYFAFWGGHEEAYRLFEKHDLHPQIWRTLSDYSSGKKNVPPTPEPSGQERLDSAVAGILPLVTRTKELGCKLGLYNHGGWGGEPQNMVAVCRRLRQLGHQHVGIVYNFHHGHANVSNWQQSLDVMLPYLLCINLNGMNDNGDPKILGIGKGQHEQEMIQAILQSDYRGPIGILDHRPEMDARESLQENLSGLETLRQTLK